MEVLVSTANWVEVKVVNVVNVKYFFGFLSMNFSCWIFESIEESGPSYSKGSNRLKKKIKNFSFIHGRRTTFPAVVLSQMALQFCIYLP